MGGAGEVHALFARIEEILLDCWATTGFGSVTVQSARAGADKVRVVVEAGTFHRFVLTREEIEAFRRRR